MTFRKVKEFFIERLIFLCGLASIIFVSLIFLFLLREGLSVFKFTSWNSFLFGAKWYPISEPPELGIWPLILGSLWVTLGAAVLSIPIGVGAAIFIAEVAPPKTKEILKAGIELLAAIPRPRPRRTTWIRTFSSSVPSSRRLLPIVRPLPSRKRPHPSPAPQNRPRRSRRG